MFLRFLEDRKLPRLPAINPSLPLWFHPGSGTPGRLGGPPETGGDLVRAFMPRACFPFVKWAARPPC